MASWRARFVLVLALLAAASCRKGDEEAQAPASNAPPVPKVKAPSGDAALGLSPPALQALTRLREVETRSAAGEASEVEPVRLVKAMAPEVLRELGTALSSSGDEANRRLGAGLLLNGRLAKEGGVALGQMVLHGDPSVREFTYAMGHDDPDFASRTLVAMYREILARVDSVDADSAARGWAYLGGPPGQATRERVEREMAEIEASLPSTDGE